MSLVSEALRKARAESIAGGAHPHAVVFRTTVVLGPRGPRIGLGWLLGGAVLAAAAAGGAVAWWLLPGRGGNSPAVISKSAAAVGPAVRPPAPASTAAHANPPTHENQTVDAPAAAAAAASRHAAASGSAPAPRNATVAAMVPAAGATQSARPPTIEAPQTRAAAPVGGNPPLTPKTARQADAGAAAAGRERTFGLDADLGYAKFHLDYIVYRSKAPFAGINGQQVTIGSVIEGFTVEEIGPDDVRLRDAKGPVVLKIP